MYDVHRLKKLAVLNWLDKQGELENWAAKVIQRAEEVFPLPLHDNEDVWIGYLPHARHVLERQKTVRLKDGRAFAQSRLRILHLGPVSRSRGHSSAGTGGSREYTGSLPSRHPRQCQ